MLVQGIKSRPVYRGITIDPQDPVQQVLVPIARRDQQRLARAQHQLDAVDAAPVPPPEHHDALVVVVHVRPEGRKFLATLDSEPTTMSPAEVGEYTKKEIEYWTKLAKKLNIVGK